MRHVLTPQLGRHQEMVMTTDEVIRLIEGAIEHFQEGTVDGVVKAWECLIPIQQDIIRLVTKRIPLPVMAGTAESEAKNAELQDACDRLVAAAESCPCPEAPKEEKAKKDDKKSKSKPKKGVSPEAAEEPEPMAADGKIILALAELIKNLIPLIPLFFKK